MTINFYDPYNFLFYLEGLTATVVINIALAAASSVLLSAHYQLDVL